MMISEAVKTFASIRVQVQIIIISVYKVLFLYFMAIYEYASTGLHDVVSGLV